jgi:integration host factor subunit beta
MNKSDLIEALSKETGLPLTRAGEVVNIVFNAMEGALAKGERVEIRGFGSIHVEHYGGYVGRNPKTGDVVRVGPKKLPVFKCSKELKRRVTPEGLTLKRGEPRKIVDEYYSVEFSTSDIAITHQFKLWNLSRGGICIMTSEESSILKHLKVGDILNMRYYKTELPEPSDYTKTEIKHITREENGRFRGHYLIGLAILEGSEA